MVLMKEKMIYFISTRNSARSHMAEAFAREYLDEKEWEVSSAGIEKGDLNPLAREVMHEIGIDISNQRSSLMDITMMERADFLVSLSDEARSKFPINLTIDKTKHWPFEDPEALKGTRDEKLEIFRRVRDQIQFKMEDFAAIQKDLMG